MVMVWAAMLTRLNAYEVSVSHVQYIGDVYLHNGMENSQFRVLTNEKKRNRK